MDPKGLSFVSSEVGPNVSEEEFHDWYNNEHSVARLTIPTFYSATRYKACDGLKPTYLVLYELSEHTVADGPEYEAVIANGSERDKRIMSTLQFLNRRSYSLIFELAHPDASTSVPAKFMFSVCLEPKAENEADKWYQEEHIPMIAKTPGWVRSRRYRLERNAVKGTLGTEVVVSKYIAFHEFTSGEYLETPEMKAVSTTPWTAEVLKDVVKSEWRQYEMLKVIQRPS